MLAEFSSQAPGWACHGARFPGEKPDGDGGEETSIKQAVCESSHMGSYMQIGTQSIFVTCLQTHVKIPGISSFQPQL